MFAALEQDVGGELGLIGDPVIRIALEQPLQERIDAFGQGVEEASPFVTRQLIGQLLGLVEVVDFQKGL